MTAEGLLCLIVGLVCIVIAGIIVLRVIISVSKEGLGCFVLAAIFLCILSGSLLSAGSP